MSASFPILRRCSVLICLVAASLAWPQTGAGPAEEHFFGPYPSWGNVKTQYGARGDGLSDDTGALQAALNDVGNSGKSSVMYLPSGTYRITATLTISNKLYIRIVGQDPSTTIIKWAGPSSGRMLLSSGVTRSSWERLTWDGSGTAGIAMGFQWQGGGYAPTQNKVIDSVIQYAAKGVVAGNVNYQYNDDTMLFLRDQFIGHSYAAISFESANTLTNNIWDCTFLDNARGVTDMAAQGSGIVYRSLFRNSSVADIDMQPNQYAFRGNTSIGSQAFYHGYGCTGNTTEVTLQKNIILDPRSTPIVVNNIGPLILLDNQIRSLPGATGPVADLGGCGWLPKGLLAVGNTVTVSNPYSVAGNPAKLYDVDTSVVAAAQISTYQPPIPATPAPATGAVFEVPAGSGQAAIQNAISQAAGFAGQEPVVHLPPGAYSISSAISVPAGLDVQIVGDSRSVQLNWSGPAGGTMFDLQGPSKASLREIQLNGGDNANGIVVEATDQPNARVFTRGIELNNGNRYNLLADRLNYAKLNFYHFDQVFKSNALAGVAVSAGSLGASASSRLHIIGGASSGQASPANAPLYSVSSQGQLAILDVWYEGNLQKFINLTDSGKVTMNDGVIAPYPGSANGDPYAITMNNFSGQFALLSSYLGGSGGTYKIQLAGSNPSMQALIAGNVMSNTPNWLDNTMSAGTSGFLANHYATDAIHAIADQGPSDAGYLRSMLSQLRAAVPEYLSATGTGVTDVRLFNVTVEHPLTGMWIKGGGAAASAGAGSASFVGFDASTQGAWQSTYGSDGYEVLGEMAAYPRYVTVTPSGQSPLFWAAFTSDPRALQQVTSTARVAAAWTAADSIAVDLNFSDSYPHRMALYFLDWDSRQRAQVVTIMDATSNAVLDTRTVSNFSGGLYLIWKVSGHVKVQLTRSAGTPVVSGLFFGGS
jgi:hypothetical protein